MDKMLEEAIKAGIMVVIAGILYWVGQGLGSIAQTRNNNKDLNREITTLKQKVEGHDRVNARLNKELDRIDDRLAEFDKRLTIAELFLPKPNKPFFPKFKPDGVKDL